MDKSEVAGKTPKMIELKTGTTYAWCACGKSANQPWCDGSHSGTTIRPKVFNVDEIKQMALCMCKQTSTPPFCDGSHTRLV